MSFLSLLMVFTLTYNFISCQDWNECRRLGFTDPENDDPFMTNCNLCILNSSTSQNCFPDFVCVQNHPGNPFHGICCRQDATQPHISAVTKPQELFATTSGQIHNACLKNEHYEECPICPEWTCDRVNEKRQKRENSNNDCSKRSKNATENCVFESGCYCNQGYARLGNKTGPCVSYADCHFSDCGPNAYFEQCPQWNDINCAEIKVVRNTSHETEMSKNIIHYCLYEGCRCKQGYARDQLNKCLRIGKPGCLPSNQDA